MGFFSLFGKKNGRQAQPEPDRSSRFKSDSHTTVPGRDMHAARVTAMKIDEIESEMSSQLMHHTLRKPLASSVISSVGTKPETACGAAAKAQSMLPELAQPTLGTMGPSTAFLLEGQTTVGAVAMPASEAAVTVEEAAILFASNQALAAEQLLHLAITEDHHCADTARIAWRMLFHLYQFTGKQQEFEHLSMEYVRRFETSPPSWNPADASGMAQPNALGSSSAPLFSLSGKLDRNCISQCNRQIERIRKLAGSHQTLHFDLSGVTEIDADGCAVLLDAFVSLRVTDHRIIFAGLPKLSAKIKAIVEIGRRDESDAAWLLLLETLRLQNLEQEFEETGLDYCVTFEVSPPPFIPPEVGPERTAAAQHPNSNESLDAFPMPRVIEGNPDQLILAIASWADKHDPAIVDCSRLMRIDFACAGRLLTGLAPFCSHGKSIEFRCVNPLVATLLDVIGLTDIVRVRPAK